MPEEFPHRLISQTLILAERGTPEITFNTPVHHQFLEYQIS